MKILEDIQKSIKELREESKTWVEKAEIEVKRNRIQKKFDLINSMRLANNFTKFNSIQDFTSYIEITEHQYLQFIKFCGLRLVKNKIKDLSDEDLITYFILSISDRRNETEVQLLKVKGEGIISKELFIRKLKVRT